MVITTPSFSEDMKTSYPMVGDADLLIEQTIIPAILTETPISPTTSLDLIPPLPIIIPIVGLTAGVVVVVIAVIYIKGRRT